MADQGGYVNDAVDQPGNSRLEGVAQSETADDGPVVAENVIGAQVNAGIHGGHAKLQELTSGFQIAESLLNHRRDTRSVNDNGKAVGGQGLEGFGLIGSSLHRGRSPQLAGQG